MQGVLHLSKHSLKDTLHPYKVAQIVHLNVTHTKVYINAHGPYNCDSPNSLLDNVVHSLRSHI